MSRSNVNGQTVDLETTPPPDLMISLPRDVADKALSMLLDSVKSSDGELERPEDRLMGEAVKLESVISAFQDHVQQYRILPIRRQQNLLLPIYRLPDELLVEIFLKVALPNNSYEGYRSNAAKYRDHTTLAAVSSRWRSTAISCPMLWGHLSSDLEPEITELMLERSKRGSLVLSCLERSTDKAQRFFDLVVPHMSRWKSLSCAPGSSHRLVSGYLVGQHLPSLESLVFPSSYKRSPTNSLNITAPLLRELRVDSPYFPLRLELGLHSRLTVLHFMARLNDIPFTTKQYHTLLSSAPCLEHIEIKGYKDYERRDPQPDNQIPAEIHLAQLKSFKLSGNLHYKTIGYLMSSVSTAPTGYPYISVVGFPSGLISSMFPERSIPNSLFEVISSSNSLSVMAGNSDGTQRAICVKASITVMDMERDLLEMNMGCSPFSMEEVLGAMLSGGCFPQIKHLTIDGLAFFNGGHLHAKFYLLPHLESLEIRERDHIEHSDLDSLIRMLASPSLSSHSGSWICSHLRSISLDTLNIDVLHSLMQLMITRTSDTGASSQVQHRLQHVELSRNVKIGPFLLCKQLVQLADERNIELEFRRFSQRWLEVDGGVAY